MPVRQTLPTEPHLQCPIEKILNTIQWSFSEADAPNWSILTEATRITLYTHWVSFSSVRCLFKSFSNLGFPLFSYAAVHIASTFSMIFFLPKIHFSKYFFYILPLFNILKN